MKYRIYIALGLLAAAALAQLLLDNSNYVAIHSAQFDGRLSIVTTVLVLLCLYFVIDAINKALSAAAMSRLAAARRKRGRANRSLVRGLLQLSAGKWAEAERTLTQRVHDASAPVAHYLAAARAAELLGARERCDGWLDKALQADAEHPAPALVTQAELYLKRNQVPKALSTLQQLQLRDPHNERGVELLARAYRHTGDWQQLQSLVPKLNAISGPNHETINEVRAQIALDRFKSIAAAQDSRQLALAWREQPSALTKRADVVVAYARAAIACRQFDAAQKSLHELLASQWEESAVLAYGDIEDAEPLDVLDRAESWLPQHPTDANLLLTCARLCIRAELYGKARSYLETSLSVRPRLETYQLLAGLAEQLGERDRAYQALNDALTYAVGRKANLPKVRARRIERRQNYDRRGR